MASDRAHLGSAGERFHDLLVSAKEISQILAVISDRKVFDWRPMTAISPLPTNQVILLVYGADPAGKKSFQCSIGNPATAVKPLTKLLEPLSGAAREALSLETDRLSAQAKLMSILPADMTVSRSELLTLDKGMGILLHASPRDTGKAHPMFALFLWPKANPADFSYQTGQGSHTFRKIGSSKQYRVYYSNVSGFMRQEVLDAFCTEEKS